MKTVFKYIVILGVLGGVGYHYREPLQNFIVPCSTPITYTLGDFDTKFGISREYFLKALADAEAIWEKPLGKEFFAYSSDAGRMKVNLVYDYRQEASNKLDTISDKVAGGRAEYDAQKAKLNTLKAQYTPMKASFDAALAAFNARKSSYDAEVARWNAQGGAPRAEYAKLEAQRTALQSEASQVQAAQVRLNTLVADINAQVAVVNRLATSLNISVDSYNDVGSSLGESFEEGLYESTAAGRSITIFEFDDRAKLVRVLAHELGHALGLDHVEDPKAIMYAFNQSANEKLTADDIAAVKTQCGIK